MLFSYQRPSNLPATSSTIPSFFLSARPPLAPDTVQLAWARVILRNNLSFSILQSSDFRDAISETSKLGKNVRVGSRNYMSHKFMPKMKSALMEKIQSMLLDAVPGAFCFAMQILHSARFPHHHCCYFLLAAYLITGALFLDGWKSKFQKSHLFGARLSFISKDFDLYSLACSCDAGANSFQLNSFNLIVCAHASIFPFQLNQRVFHNRATLTFFVD